MGSSRRWPPCAPRARASWSAPHWPASSSRRVTVSSTTPARRAWTAAPMAASTSPWPPSPSTCGSVIRAFRAHEIGIRLRKKHLAWTFPRLNLAASTQGSIPMAASIETRNLVGSALAVLLVGIAFITVLRFMDQTQASADRRGQLNAALQTLEQGISQLKDAETGQRGFLLTGNPEYLAPYESGREQAPVRSE